MILPLTRERMTVQRLSWVTLVHQQGRTRQGPSLLAASHPEWQSSIDETRQALLAVV